MVKDQKRVSITDQSETQSLIPLIDSTERIPTELFSNLIQYLSISTVYPRNLICSHESTTTKQENE